MPNGYNGPGVTNCYDYAFARGEGCSSGPYLGAKGLTDHKSVRSKTTYANPMDAQGQYGPGDWLVTSGGHAGYVNDQGRIDHYHQYSDGKTYKSGQRYLDPNNMPPEDANGMGGLRTNDDLYNFLHSGDRYHPSRPFGGNVQVLRRR